MDKTIISLIEAIEIITDCGDPEKVSLYDEEGVEGWRWTSSDGQEWTEIGSWDEVPMHPAAFAAIELADWRLTPPPTPATTNHSHPPRTKI